MSTTEIDLSNQTPDEAQPESRTLHMDSDNQSSTGIATVCQSVLDVDQPTLKPDGQQSVESPKAGDTNVLSSVNPTDNATDSKSRTTKSEEDLVKSLDCVEEIQPTSLTESVQTGQSENAYSQHLQPPVCAGSSNGDADLSSQNALMLSVRHTTDMDVLQNQEVETISEIKARSVSYQKSPASPDQNQQQGPESAIPNVRNEPDIEQAKSEEVSFGFRQESEHTQGEVDFSHAAVEEVHENTTTETDLSNQTPVATQPDSCMVLMDSDNQCSPGTSKVYTIILDVDQPELKPETHQSADDNDFGPEKSTAKSEDFKSERGKSNEALMQSLDSLEQMQLTSLTESVQPRQAENVHPQQVQNPAEIEDPCGDVDVSHHQASTLSDRDSIEAVVVQNQAVHTKDPDAITISYRKHAVSVVQDREERQQTSFGSDKSAKVPDTEQVKEKDRHRSKHSSSVKKRKKNKGLLNTDQTITKEDSKIETTISKQMSDRSPLHPQTTSARHLDAKDTTQGAFTEEDALQNQGVDTTKDLEGRSVSYQLHTVSIDCDTEDRQETANLIAKSTNDPETEQPKAEEDTLKFRQEVESTHTQSDISHGPVPEVLQISRTDLDQRAANTEEDYITFRQGTEPTHREAGVSHGPVSQVLEMSTTEIDLSNPTPHEAQPESRTLHMDSDNQSSTGIATVCQSVLDVDQPTLKPDGQQSVESPKAGDTNVLSSVSPTDNATVSKSRTTKSEEDLVKSLDCVVEIQPTSLTESVQTGQPENAYSQHLQPPVCAGSSNGDADLSSQKSLMLSVRHTTDMDVLQNQEVETISEIKARSVSYQKSPASPDQNQQQGPESAIPNDRNELDIEQAKSEEVSIVFRQGSEHTQGEADFSHAAVEEVHENTTTESDLSNQTPDEAQPESRTLHMDSDNQSSTGIATVCQSILDVDQPTLKPDGQQSVESPKAGDTNVLSSVNPTDSATDSKSRTTKSEEDLVKSLDNPTNPNNQRQSITLTESMQTGQTDNAHSQQLQTPVCAEHYTGDTYLICPEPCKLSDKDIMDMDVLQSQELNAKSVSYQQHTVSVDQDREDRQETTNLDDKTEPDNEDSKSEHDYISRLGTDPAHTDTDISLCPVPEVLLSETDLSNEIPDANKFESKMPCMKSETESRPETDKVCTIILDVDLPMLKLDGQEPMEFPKAGDASEFRSNSTANANYSKSGTTKSEEDLAQSLDSLVESQTENVSGDQDCMLLCKDITEVHVLHTEGVVTVEEHDVTSKIIRARKNYLGGEDWQESKNINEAHTELAKGGDNECLKLSSALKGKKKKKRSSDSDQTNHEEKSTTETSSSKQMSEGSFLHHQSTTTRHANAPDTTLSTSTEYIQKDTSKSMNVFSLDGKAVDAVAISNDLDSPENTDRQLSDTSTALVCTTHASDIGSHSTNIKSTDFKFTIEKQVPNSGEISETSRTETESTLQLEFSIHAKAGSKEQAEDPDSNDCLQPEEMSKTKTKVSGSEGVECEHFKDNSKKTRTANQPAQASALDTLLDISTNVHTVMDTCDVPSRDKPREVTSLLESPLTELENRLGRAVLRILKCRYQPAQLSTELLSKQLQEAESCRQYVGEQLASQSQWGGSGLSQVNQRMVERWNSAMLDATATVQVKEAQLQQVTKYHQQILVLQDVLQELEEELDSLSLVSLESSAVQAKNLCAFLEHMKQKNSMLEELMTLCCHMSPYLGEADGPVACLIQIKNLQKKWQILEWTAERSLRHANHCMSEVSILMKDAKALLVEVELLHTASSSPSTQIKDCQWAIHNMITFFQFVEINERYLHLHGLSQALFQCPLGEKEKEDISNVFQNLKAQLDCAQEKLCIDATCPRDHLLAEITDTMKSWFSWATQTESTITRKKKLSLFPEEATQQVNSMKKLQSEISSRQLKLPSAVTKIKQEIAGLSQVESSLMLSALQTLENIYSKISEKSERVTADLNQMLHARQRLDMQITDNSTWLASLFENESNKAAAILLGSSITDLRVYHQKHKTTLKEAEKRLSAIQTLLDNTKDMIPDLSIVDSFHLINRLTTLQEEINGVVKCKRTTCWELEEILHAQESSTEEFATIQKSLRQIKTDLEKQRYPVTRDSLAAFDPIRRMLIEHLSQVLEVPHCKENQRKELLRTILNLQENMRMLDWQSMEHEEYLTSKKHLQTHFEAVKMRVLEMSDSSRNTDKRLLMAQTLLVKIPLVRISCQKTAEQLEAISGDLFPSQLNSERQKIRSMLQSLTAWESIVSTDVKNQEDTLFTSSLNNLRDLTPLTEHFMRVEELLKQNTCLDPSDQAITIALQTCLTLERSVASGLRILESCIDCTAIEGHGKTTNIGRRILKDCKMQLENLLEAKEALKEYHSAVRRAVGFLQQIETKLLVPSASFKDSKEELNYTEQLNTSLAKGFQDHMNELQAILPSQACFSPQTKKLHIQVVSYLHVTDAKLEAQAQLKLDALQRYLMEQATYTKQHDDMNCLLQNFDFQLSDSFSHKPISVDECEDQLEKMNVLQEELVNMGRRLEELKDKCPLLNCNVGAEKTLGHLQSQWALLQQRLDTLKSRVAHTETQWKEIMLRTKRCREALDHLQHSISEISKMKGSLGKLQEILGQTEQLQNELDQERLILVSLQRHVSRLLNASNLHNTPSQISQELQSLLSRCRSLREQSSEVRHDLLSEIQECGRSQEELKGLQQSVLSLLSVLQGQSDPSHIREVREEVDSQKVRLQDIMDRVRVRMRNNNPPQEIQNLYDQVTLSLKEIKDKVGQAMERSGSLQKMNEHVYKVTEGLSRVKALLQQKSPTVKEAESILKRVWDELDQWHSRITELEAEVQELAEEQPERAHILMDELTKPLQLYQAVAKQAEQRTAFINRIPTCLQEYEDILRNSTFWLAETQSWLKTAQTYTTAKCLHSHANSLQMVLDESEGMQRTLEAFGASLQEISAVYDTSTEEQNLFQIRTNISHMQRSVLEPLSQLQHAAAEMDAIEAEVKTMEKSIMKIRSILSTVETEHIPPEEHLLNRQVILENLQAMQRTLAEIERCRDGLGLPTGAELSLSVFHRAEQLHPHINELQQLTEEQSTAFRAAIGHSVDLISPTDGGMVSSLALHCSEDVMVPMDTTYSKEEDDDDYEDEGSHSSSSETLTCSGPEDPDESSLGEDPVETSVTTRVQVSVTKESLLGATERLVETKRESVTLPTQLQTISNTTNSRSADDDDTAYVPVIAPEMLLPLTVDPAVQLKIPTKETEDIKYAETTEMAEGVTHKNELQPEQIGTSAVKHGPVRKNNNVVDMRTESGIHEILTERVEEFRSRHTEEENIICVDHTAVETTVSTLDTDTVSLKDPDETPVDEASAETTASTVVQVSVTKDSPPKEIEKSVESVPLKTETKPENGTSSKRESVAKDAGPVSATVCTQYLDASIPLTTDPAVQLNIPTKITGKETEETLKDIKPALKPEQIGASTITPGLVSKDKEIVDMESDLQEMLEESKFKPIEKESAVSEDQQRSVSFLAAVPILDTNTTPLEDTVLQEVQNHLQEQRDLVENIARQSSSSDLEQENQAQSQKPTGSIGGSLNVPQHPAEIEVTWVQLLPRLDLLLDSINTELDRTKSEVKSIAEDEVVSDAGSSITQEMNGHTKRLQLIHHKRLTLATPAVIVLSELCEALTGLSHSLFRITHTLQSPSETIRETSQLHLLNDQCLSTQLASLSSMISSMGPEITASGVSDATSCLEQVSSCISSIQRALSSQMELLNRQLGHTPQLQIAEQLLESPVSVLEAKGAQHSKSTSFIRDLSSLQGVQGKVWSSMRKDKRTGQEVSALHRCYQANLQGLRDLLELGSERLQHSQVTHQHSCSQLQSLLRGHKRYFKELRWYHAMIQHLSKQIPEGPLQDQEEVEQLVSELVLQALGQGVHIQHNLEECARFEEMRVKLRRQLDELEAAMPSNDLNSQTETRLQDRLQAYQQLQRLHKDVRPQLELLQALVLFPERVNHTGPVSELQTNWLALHRQLEQEIQRTKEMQVNYDRFQCSSSELEVWMASALANVHMWNNLCDPNPQDSEFILPNIMNFFKELESRSVQKATAVRAGTQVLQLSDTEAPELRQHLFQLEQDWTELTNAAPSVQHTLQQLLAGIGQSEVRTYLSAWVEKMKSTLEEESSREHHALNSTELTMLLQHLMDCKAEMTSRKPCIDFLNHSVEETGFVDDAANRNQRLTLAEQLGALNLDWVLLQRKIDIKMREIEHKKQDCAQREGLLQRLRSWISVQEKKMRVNERPAGWTQIQQALKDSEEEEEEQFNLKSTELLHLRTLNMLGLKDGQHPGDQTFSSQVESTSEQFQTLRQQMSVVRAALVRLNEQWVQLDAALRDAALHTVSMTYKLECSKIPTLSLQQSKEHVHQLQELQMEGEQSEQTWTNLASLFLELKDKIHPAAAVLLSNEFDQGKARWAAVVREVSLELQKAQMELRLWQEYRLLYEGCSEHLTHYWEQCEAFLSLPKKQEYNIELLQSRINNISEFEDKLEALRANVGNVIEASKLLIVQLEPQAAPVIQSESRLLSRDLVHLSQALVKTREQLQEELEDHVCFSTDLGSLMQCLKRSESVLASPMSSIEHLKLALLELSSLTPALGALNQQSLRLALTSSEAEQLQVLNTHWVQVFTKEMNRHREMYSAQLCDQSFQQKYQAWMILLEKLESGLSSGISGNDFSVREQLAVHQKLKMEVLIGQQLLDAVVSEELARLDESQVEDRKDQRLTQLKERWQGTLSRVQQRSRCLEQQTEQWSLYRTGLKRLWRLLKNLEPLLSPAGSAPCRFQQLQQSIQDYEQAQEKLSDHEELYTQTVQVYRQILPLVDVQTQAELKAEIGALQEAWEQSNGLIVKRKALSETVIKSWSCCEDGLADSALHLREIAVRLKQLPPDNIELQEKLFKEDENSLELWAGRLKKLVAMKTDISQYVLPTDTVLLQGQLEELHSQWEELCLKVSKRKQEISDRLNAWTIFNDKHKELCEWLAQMERKVMHSSDYFSIEEMVEKLKKDCTEEMNLFNENKSHLKRLGEQLLLVSDQAKEANIHGVLQDVNDRWQHLFDQIEARVNKLKDTLAAVQQLDKNMSNLRSWLSRIEAELTKPVHYSTCNGDEIQKRLEEQQELQKDIVQHTESITSVLTLCDMLLHDEDACSNNSENDSIQQTTHSLDQRWRNICSMSLERKIRTEETWRLWCKFQDDYSQFEDWLNVAEQTSAEPESADVLYTVAKEELKRYEAFQRDVQEKLAQLEMINSRYRRLARENRTDSANRLRTMVHQGNQRWDALHKRVAAILRRLRHFTAQRDDFEGTRENLLVWLTEMDLELTNVEHFTESDIEHKLKKLKGLKKKITQNTDKIDALIVFGEGLIQRSAPEDAALIEDELENLHSYCQEVFSRVGCFHQRLTSPQRLLDKPELCISESSAGMEDSNVAEQTHDTSTSQASMSLLVPPQERSGCETPLSVDSIPLEWDHTGDVCGSSSHEEDDDASFFSCLSGVRVKESSEAVVNYTVQSLTVTSAPGRDVEAQSWHSQAVPDKILFPLPDAKEHTPDLPKHESTPYKQGYVQLTSECSSSIKNVKKVSLILDDDELQEDQGGLTSLTAADKQSRVIERWELLQAQTVREEQCYSRDREQLTSDLHDITSWLDQVIPELEKLQNAETTCVSVQIMEARVKHLKDMQKAFARYKTLMLSLNLGGRELKCETGPEVQQVQEDLCSMNQSWNKACTSLDEWEDNLRKSFMHCQEFHETLHSLLLWLAHAESRRFTVNIHDPSVLPSVLHEHRTALMGLEEELKARQGRVSSLQEITNELLPESGAEDDFEVTEKLHVIHKKLRLLLHQVKQDLQTVQERLDSSEALAASDRQDPGSSSTELTASRSSSATRTQNRDSSPPRSFFYRVLRAAFPLHVLFLLLLVFACLVPLSEEDYSCTLSNNFARSFYPMLRYTNGPPPT
ncbi:hypothetical protein AMELA_G00277550 [Ameiurus melas]|uniref:KASH domain-containing protein n=1 Tax=Ameiurus melas TaxID=219545 RepID=A0A7J5ZJD5_AMEME|nr:hypothetical protein AMELA_G00277550 [Ameiurus melas]